MKPVPSSIPTSEDPSSVHPKVRPTDLRYFVDEIDAMESAQALQLRLPTASF